MAIVTKAIAAHTAAKEPGGRMGYPSKILLSKLNSVLSRLDELSH